MRNNESSRVTSGSRVCACGGMVVPFMETGNTGKESLIGQIMKLILDIIWLRFL